MGLFDERQQRRFIEEDQALEEARSAASDTQRGRVLKIASPHDDDARDDHATQARPRAEPAWPQVVLRLDQFIVDRLLAVRGESGMAIEDVVLRAFDRYWLHLHQIAPPPVWVSPLPLPTRLRPPVLGPTRTVRLLLTPAQFQQLEDAADRSGGGGLTDVVEYVLRHYFELAFVAADCLVWTTFVFEHVARRMLMPGYPRVDAGRVSPARGRAAVPPENG